MENVKRIPYGVSDFVDIIKRNQYYVDKTMYIPKLEEEADSLFFIRPRRFGKSLLLSMMCAYYDINQSDRFEELFGKLWIGSHPTPYRGKFQVLFLDFSKIGGDIKDLKENFNNYCNIRLDNFIERYKRAYRPEIVEKIKSAPTAVDKLNMIDTEAKDANMQLYLIIDEYDNFTNVVAQRAWREGVLGIDPCERLLSRDFQGVQGYVHSHLHDRSQSCAPGRPNQWLQYRLAHIYKASLQSDVGVLYRGCT